MCDSVAAVTLGRSQSVWVTRTRAGLLWNCHGPSVQSVFRGPPPGPSPASLRRGALAGCLRPSTATPWDTYGRQCGRPASCCFGRPTSCGAACGHGPAALQASPGTPSLSGPLRSAAERCGCWCGGGYVAAARWHGRCTAVVQSQLGAAWWSVDVAWRAWVAAWELRGRCVVLTR